MPTILVANRGEIAVRIVRTARRMGSRTVAVYSDADVGAEHVAVSDVACRIGPPAPADSYLRIEAIIEAARRAGATAVHPGYGFLSERAEFAAACRDAGLIFIGPSPEAMRQLGDKVTAKSCAMRAGIPVVPGYAADDMSVAACRTAAERIGYPVMIKAAAGGGGRGMRRVASPDELADALRSARTEAGAAFGDDRVLLERALDSARHIEVQVFGDAHGHYVHLGERDCSVQRRHQKIIEEAPSPAVTPALRDRLGAAAIAIARAAGYTGAGTVEFLLDETGRFYFIEVNTRLQVEHPVTEAITGLDLVEWQIRVALGEALPCGQDQVRFDGHAIEVRLCAEDPARDFAPQVGTIRVWRPPERIRVDHALRAGAPVPSHYDSLVAKLIAHGRTRDDARINLIRALDDCVLLGVPTNREFLSRCLQDEVFRTGAATTAFLAARASAFGTPARAAGTSDWALGAALWYIRHTQRACLGQWAGWSSGGPRSTPLRLHFDHEEGPVSCDVMPEATTRLRVTIGTDVSVVTIHDVAADDAGEACIEVDGLCNRVAFACDATSMQWQFGAVAHRLVDMTLAPRAAARNTLLDGCLRALIHGRVLAVLTEAGASAAAGTPLVILEAMKMEHSLMLPVSARVTEVGVAVGAQVSVGDVLLRYEPSEGQA